MEHIRWFCRISHWKISFLDILIKLFVFHFYTLPILFSFVVNNSSIWVCKLKKSLNSTARMFRSCTIKTMREDQGKPSLSHPFVLTVNQMGINKNLSRIEEISKLSLPNDHIKRIVNRISILKGHCSILCERTIKNLNFSSSWILMTEKL